MSSAIRNERGEIVTKIDRVSDLPAPIMLLSGHNGPVTSVSFSPINSCHLASTSLDGNLNLWRMFDCANVGTLKADLGFLLHSNWINEQIVLACGTNGIIAAWDITSGSLIRRYKTSVISNSSFSKRSSSAIINCITSYSLSPLRSKYQIAAACDDGLIRFYDSESKALRSVIVNKTGECDLNIPLTSVKFLNESTIASAGIDNSIKIWDMRNASKALHRLIGHSDSITGLDSVENFICSQSMDGSVRVWDWIESKSLQTYDGIHYGADKNLLRPKFIAASETDIRLAAGSSEGMVYVWNISKEKVTDSSSKLLYKLPGHSGSVTGVAGHASQPIIASCGIDGKIYVGELPL